MTSQTPKPLSTTSLIFLIYFFSVLNINAQTITGTVSDLISSVRVSNVQIEIIDNVSQSRDTTESNSIGNWPTRLARCRAADRFPGQDAPPRRIRPGTHESEDSI